MGGMLRRAEVPEAHRGESRRRTAARSELDTNVRHREQDVPGHALLRRDEAAGRLGRQDGRARCDGPHDPSDQEVTKRMIVAALALAGIFISLYLTLYKLGVIGELSCSIGSCETVNTSKYSRFLGLPVAAWGLLFYLDVFAIGLIGTVPRFEDERVISIVLVAEAAVGVLFSAWLTYVELGVIHAICIWCVTSAVIVTVVLLVSVADLREFGLRRG